MPVGGDVEGLGDGLPDALDRVTRLGLRKLEVLRGGRQLSRHHLGDVRFAP